MTDRKDGKAGHPRLYFYFACQSCGDPMPEDSLPWASYEMTLDSGTEVYALFWPAGWQQLALMDGGGFICPDCVKERRGDYDETHG